MRVDSAGRLGRFERSRVCSICMGEPLSRVLGGAGPGLSSLREQMTGETIRGSEVEPSARRHRVDPERICSHFHQVLREVEGGDRAVETEEVLLGPGSVLFVLEQGLKRSPQTRQRGFEE